MPLLSVHWFGLKVLSAAKFCLSSHLKQTEWIEQSFILCSDGDLIKQLKQVEHL